MDMNNNIKLATIVDGSLWNSMVYSVDVEIIALHATQSSRIIL